MGVIKASQKLFKKYISGSIWHKSFIHTLKYSIFEGRRLYQSFWDAPFTLQVVLIFFSQREFCLAVRGDQSATLMNVSLVSETSRQTCTKYIPVPFGIHRSFKRSNTISFVSKFLRCAVYITSSFKFFFQREFCLASSVDQSTTLRSFYCFTKRRGKH